MTTAHRGEVTAQVVIIIPTVVLVLLLAIQGALYFHVSHVAGAAAAQGASSASAKDLTLSEAVRRGRERADSLAADAGTELVAPTAVIVSGDVVQVTVRALVPRIVPFFPTTAIRTVIEPRERFIEEYRR
ncbi:MAG: TadE/TadG family type IV pilus assembly protein [Actinomycetota bacterium]